MEGVFLVGAVKLSTAHNQDHPFHTSKNSGRLSCPKPSFSMLPKDQLCDSCSITRSDTLWLNSVVVCMQLRPNLITCKDLYLPNPMILQVLTANFLQLNYDIFDMLYVCFIMLGFFFFSFCWQLVDCDKIYYIFSTNLVLKCQFCWIFILFLVNIW